MELPVYLLGKRFADSFHLAELLDAGLPDFTQSAKVSQQAAPALVADPADFFQ